MKDSKVKKDNTNKLPLLDIIDSFSDEVKSDYWNFVHTMYIYLESSLEDKNEAVINTLSIEMTKRNEVVKEDPELLEAENQALIERAENTKKLKKKLHRKRNMPSISSLMDKISDNPEMAAMLSTMTGGKSNKELDNMMNHAMKDNPEYADMIYNFMDQMASGESNEESNFDLDSLISQFMPEMDTNSKINSVLMNKILKDVIYVFSKTTDDGTTFKERLTVKIKAYQRVFESGSLSPMDMVGCLIKITSDDALKEQISNIEMEEVSMTDMIAIASEILPPEIMEKFGDLSNLGPDSLDINGLMSMFTGMSSGKIAEQIVEVALTEEQELELEAYYDKLMIENTN